MEQSTTRRPSRPCLGFTLSCGYETKQVILIQIIDVNQFKWVIISNTKHLKECKCQRETSQNLELKSFLPSSFDFFGLERVTLAAGRPPRRVDRGRAPFCKCPPQSQLATLGRQEWSWLIWTGKSWTNCQEKNLGIWSSTSVHFVSQNFRRGPSFRRLSSIRIRRNFISSNWLVQLLSANHSVD